MNVNYLEVGDRLEVHIDFTVHPKDKLHSLGDSEEICDIVYVDSDYIIGSYYGEKHILLRIKGDFVSW